MCVLLSLTGLHRFSKVCVSVCDLACRWFIRGVCVPVCLLFSRGVCCCVYRLIGGAASGPGPIMWCMRGVCVVCLGFNRSVCMCVVLKVV